MAGTSRISAISTVTRSRISAMFAGLPPYSGNKLSTRSKSAPSATSRAATVEPMKPRPPVTMTRAPEKTALRSGGLTITAARGGRRVGDGVSSGAILADGGGGRKRAYGALGGEKIVAPPAPIVILSGSCARHITRDEELPVP